MVKEEIKIGNVKVLVNDEYVVAEDEVEKVLEEVGKNVYKTLEKKEDMK